jgi:hypothetical protein
LRKIPLFQDQVDFCMRPLQEISEPVSMGPEGHFQMTSRRPFRRSVLLAGALALASFSASPARADRCDDVAKQLASQIDGVKVTLKARNIVYMTHPATKEFSIGCRGQNYSLELYAKTDRKFKPAFLDLVANAGAIVFTIPKPDVATGSSRCMKRMGILRGDKVSMRFRRLNMECTRTKTESSIAITRGKDE